VLFSLSGQIPLARLRILRGLSRDWISWHSPTSSNDQVSNWSESQGFYKFRCDQS